MKRPHNKRCVIDRKKKKTGSEKLKPRGQNAAKKKELSDKQSFLQMEKSYEFRMQRQQQQQKNAGKSVDKPWQRNLTSVEDLTKYFPCIFRTTLLSTTPTGDGSREGWFFFVLLFFALIFHKQTSRQTHICCSAALFDLSLGNENSQLTGKMSELDPPKQCGNNWKKMCRHSCGEFKTNFTKDIFMEDFNSGFLFFEEVQ